jgi:uncharacterized protein (TIGR03118 family)
VTAVNANGFVGIPTTASGPQGPTGQVNNSNTASFQLSGTAASSSRFIFANLNGTISGWAGGLTSTVTATTPGAVYTGLAINTAGTRLYAANSAGTGSVNVFDSSFAPVTTSGAFKDPSLPAGLVPFNVQNIGGKIYVTYAPSGVAAQRAATAGQGVVDIFDENGGFLQRFITGSQLAAPWAVALAPSTFGAFGGDILVGNFSFATSEINAFDPTTGTFEGSIPINVGAGNTPGGLWNFVFGSGAGSGGDANTLYFVDGINGETAGLFGALTVPEPSSMALLGVSAAFIGVRRLRLRRRARAPSQSAATV